MHYIGRDRHSRQSPAKGLATEASRPGQEQRPRVRTAWGPPSSVRGAATGVSNVPKQMDVRIEKSGTEVPPSQQLPPGQGREGVGSPSASPPRAGSRLVHMQQSQQQQRNGKSESSNDILRQARDRAQRDRNRLAREAAAEAAQRAAPRVPKIVMPVLGLHMPDTNRTGGGVTPGGRPGGALSAKYAGIRSSGYGGGASSRAAQSGAGSSRLTGYDSNRPPAGFNSNRVAPSNVPGRSSVASNVTSARLDRSAVRVSSAMPSLEEIAKAITERPHLTAQIVAIRDDATLDKQRRMWEIAKIIREADAPPPEATPLEIAQAKFIPTHEQKAGRRTATVEHNARVKANEGKRVYMPPAQSSWVAWGGESIDSMLDNVDLIDGRYLVSLHRHGGNLPRWQNVPDSAKITRSTVWRLYGWEMKMSLPILVLSYPWLDETHPDRQGETLAKVAEVLEYMLPCAGGDAFTVGVLWDYASLPQPMGEGGIRNGAELARFRGGLRSLMTWYAHPYTHTLLVNTPLPTGAEYGNKRPYAQRGWCEIERRAANIAKSVTCLWDLSGFKPEQLEKFTGVRKFEVMRNQLVLGPGVRDPPLSPPVVEAELRRRVGIGEIAFADERDIDLVVEMYQRGFVTVYETYNRLDPQGCLGAYAGLAWTEAEARMLAGALAYAAEKCKFHKDLGPTRLSLGGNFFEDGGRKAIQQAVQFSKCFGSILF